MESSEISSSASDFLLHFQGDLSRSCRELSSQDTMFPFRCSQLLLSCILLVALVQLPRSESRPATESTDTGETLRRCRPIKPAGENIKMCFLVTATVLILKKKSPLTKTRCLQMLEHLMGLSSLQDLIYVSSGLLFR